MYQFLDFPLDNKVNKNITVDQFVNKANLTDYEKKVVMAHLKSIDIMYSFCFDDGEVNVILAEFSMVNGNAYTYDNFVRAIAKSVPYDILLIMKVEGVYSFFTFWTEENRVNYKRKSVQRIFESQGIVPILNDYFDQKFINNMRQVAECAQSSEELYNRWILLCNQRVYSEDDVIECAYADLEKYCSYKLYRNRIEGFEKKDSIQYSFDTEKSWDDVSDFFGRYVIDCTEEGEAKEFKEFCASYSRYLYSELGGDLSEEEWIIKYIEGCNQYCLMYFNRALSDSIVYEIKDSFWEDNCSYQEGTIEFFSLDTLAECIEEVMK